MQISIDGQDCCGKTKQLFLLKEYLEQQHEVVLVKCPSNIGTSGVLRNIVLHHPVTSLDSNGACWPHTMGDDISLMAGRWAFFAEQLHTYETQIKPALDAGKLVLMDRSHFTSNIAYGLGLGLDIVNVMDITNMQKIYVPAPDLCIIIDVSYEVACQRLKRRTLSGGECNHFDDINSEVFALRKKGFDRTLSMFPWTRIISGEDEIIAVHHAIRNMVDRFLSHGTVAESNTK